VHAATDRAALGWHVLLIVALSAGYEALFLERSNGELFDEGWPLYAAMRLHAGGVLYRDVFFVFPPGHVLPAWLAYWIDPPGVVLARGFYAAFNVALCVPLYLLGRRIMPPRYALFSALLVAVAAPHSHMGHLLFGYRYLVFSALALLAFSRWLDDRRRGWLLLAGVWTGFALVFRATPAFAASCGIGLGIWSAQRGAGLRPSRDSWAGGGCFAAGLLAVAVPVLLWFASAVGLDGLWRENVIRVMGLQQLQSLPVPSLTLPDFADRRAVHYWLVGVQYWSYTALYSAYTIALCTGWRRARRQGRDYEHALLLAITVWGGVFLLRTLGRSDDHHLNSALPPVCLLLGHLAALAWQRIGKTSSEASRASGRVPSRRLRGVELALLFVAFAGWLVIQGHDRHFNPFERGWVPIEAGSDSPEGGLKVAAERAELERLLRVVEESTDADDTILDLSASPLLYPLSGRSAVGEFDIFMPGSFLDDEEESRFVARLDARPPALVIWPGWPFDTDPERAVQRTAPRVSQWVKERYRPRDSRRTSRRFVILVPR
jgi:hypothetical protein